VIRNAVIHLLSEQPVTADLFELPKPGDALLVCTNLRTLDGKRPVFIDQIESTFVFPYLHVRFVEIRPERPGAPAAEAATSEAPREPGTAADADIEIDEDFLRRIREA
jgi:hypothetical protein